jgi:rRNA maturation endonuclease Nob1
MIENVLASIGIILLEIAARELLTRNRHWKLICPEPIKQQV